MEASVTASQGAIRSLPMKLECLLSPNYGLQREEGNEINRLKLNLQQVLDYGIEPSEVVAPASTANCWADEVRELSYDIEDFIDEIVHAGGKPRESIIVTNEILGFKARVVQVMRWHECYLANCEMRPSTSSSGALGNWPPHPQRQQLRLVGIDKSSIKELYGLLVNDGKPEQKVASIVGVAGIGKTTLARELYRQLRQQYQCRAFVQASRKPDVRKLLTSILSQVRRHQLLGYCELEKLVEELNVYLKDKTYFIIIDNLSSPSMWNLVNRALPKDGCCSRVLATTEVDVVAQICCAGNSKYIYKKEPLSEDESRQLFSSTLLGCQSKFPEHLNNVLYEIINRCGGLPLAVIAMANVLACQSLSIEQCNYLRNSLDLGLVTNPNLGVVKQVLNLGYNSLPHWLKACMLYLSLYEEDCIIWKVDLIKQWIAEGFIGPVEGNTSREETAGGYFDELVNRGMIQPEDINCNDEVLSCTVHRMVHQFIRDNSIEKNFSISIDDSQTSIRHAEKVRRLGLHFGNAEDATLPETLRLSRIRSLAFSGLLKCMPSIEKFRFLQVLILKLLFDSGDLMSHNLTEPDGVSFNLTGILSLFRLKYLSIGVSQCHVSVELPTQMQQLKELVALEIQAKLTAAVPSDTFDLPAGLLYLCLPSEARLPVSIGRMTSLCTLRYFDLSINSTYSVINIGKLINLQELHLTCSTVQSHNLKINMELLGSVLEELRNLKCLTLAPSAGSSRVDTPNGAGSSSASISFDVFSLVSPPVAPLEKLELSRRCCIFSSLPEWTNKLARLRILKIAVGKLLTHGIDVLGGLPALAALSLYIQAAPVERIVFSVVGFSVLRYFKFRCSVPLLKFEAGAMPNLQKLKLGFNAPVAEQHSAEHISIEHLSSLTEISAKIRGVGADAESTLRTAANKHASNPSINIVLVDCIIYGEESISMSTKGKESIAPDQQDAIMVVKHQDECSTQVDDKGEDEHTSQQSLQFSGVGRALSASVDLPLQLHLRVSVLDPLVGSCITKLQQIIAEKAVLTLGVKEELKKLQGTIKQIRFFLDDAEKRRIKESAVNNWFSELRDAMYDADDIVDLARFEGSKLLKDRRSSSSKNSTAGFRFLLLSCFPVILRHREIAVKIRDLNDRVEQLSKHGNNFLHLGVGPTGQGSTSKRRESSKLVQPKLVGKEIMHSSKKLVDLVLAGKEQKDYKLAIVGTGGVGKTTLAQKIYNDKKIKLVFEKQAWVCVSQDFNEVNLLKEILRNIGVYQDQGETIAELQNRIAETIEGKSFFLVLDDVWKSSVIDLIEAPIYVTASSVILVTTRDDRIAMDIHAWHTHRVNLLSEEVAWELLWKSMNIDEEKEVQNLRNIGIQIIQKCGYLPLAIKVIARVLTSKDQTESMWKKILSKISAWSESKLHDDIEGALYLSYNELPHHLKQCFLYCALYPEDSIIPRDDIVRLWVAEGFVEEQEGQLLEETGEEYYNELIHRNLLQPDGSTFDHASCKMHDLLRQLACYLSRDECFTGDPESLEGQSMTKLRRISAVTKKDMLVFPTMNKEHLKVRTLVRRFNGLSQGVDHSIFKKLLRLHVLDLTGSSIQTIPDCIANLIHLRLLDLDGTKISCLPESIGSLINLQTLNLQRCDALHSLPSTITQLCNLRRLGLDGTPINQVPEGIGGLAFLNDLEGFPIGGGTDCGKAQDGWKLEELQHLLQLRRLDMIQIERAKTCSTDSLLMDKKYLKILNLFCTKHPVESYSEDVGNIEKIFEQLIPPHNLEQLFIVDFFGPRFPTWLVTTHLVCVKSLVLIDCNSCVHLPPLGQLPNLNYLRIDGAAAVTKIGPEFVGCGGDNYQSTVAVAFPKLELLIIENMLNWEEWSFVEGDSAAASMEGEEDGSAEIRKGEAPSPRLQVLPRLKNVELLDCPMLRALPRQLGQEATCLEVLHLRGASSLKVVEDLPFLSEKLLIQGCEVLDRISNLPQVRELFINYCPDLSCVDGLGSLVQLWLTKNMQEVSSQWVVGLQQQCHQLHDEDLEVYTWV